MLNIYTVKQSEKWDEIVSSFKDYDVYWLSGYVKAFVIHGDGEPLLFYYEDDKTRGINVVMKRDISLDKHFKDLIPQNSLYDLSTPYGYGGWLIEGEDSKALFSEYENWCKNNSVISEFVRFHPILNNHLKVKNVYNVIPLGETVSMDLTNDDIIWENLTSKNRNIIRRAEKNGIKILSDLNTDILSVFKEIYDSTMDKDDADSYYYFTDNFYKSINCDLNENAKVFYAMSEDGKIIAASIMIYANGRLNYHLSGSRKEYQHLAPSNLMLLKAAQWGSKQGMKTFHLGGGRGSMEDSLLHFKKAFYRGELCRFHIGQKIFDLKKYNELVAMRNEVNKDFFPLYRA